jgi:hypothetical protein
MKVERFKRGSGITERTVERKTAETIEDMQLLAANSQHFTYPKYLDRLERQATMYLEQKGLPHAPTLMNLGSGWEPSKSIKDTRTPFRKMILPKVMDELGWAEDSWPGYAARIIWRVHRIKTEATAQNKDVWRIADLAHGLGELVSQSGFKRKFEKAALRGRDVRKGAHEGGDMRAKMFRPRNEKMATEFLGMRAKHPISAKSDTALKCDIGKKYHLSRSAAVEAINAGLKNLSGTGANRTR